MPLPNLIESTRCEGITRNGKNAGQRCKNLRAWGQRVCKCHGARKRIPKGDQHHWHQHGKETVTIRNERLKAGRQLHELLAEGIRTGLFPKNTKLTGRPPAPRKRSKPK